MGIVFRQEGQQIRVNGQSGQHGSGIGRDRFHVAVFGRLEPGFEKRHPVFVGVQQGNVMAVQQKVVVRSNSDDRHVGFEIAYGGFQRQHHLVQPVKCGGQIEGFHPAVLHPGGNGFRVGNEGVAVGAGIADEHDPDRFSLFRKDSTGGSGAVFVVADVLIHMPRPVAPAEFRIGDDVQLAAEKPARLDHRLPGQESAKVDRVGNEPGQHR